MNALLSTGKILAIQLFFLTTFLLGALGKWSAGVTPVFLQQFGSTWLANLPGGLPAVYFFLAALETIAVIGFAASLLTGEFLHGKAKPLLKITLVFSLFVFIVLAFGSRLTAKFDVAAINLLYFLGALVCFRESRPRGDAGASIVRTARVWTWSLVASILLVRPSTAAEEPSKITWRPYSDSIFEEAKRENRFVLLDLEAVWCHWCHVMDEVTYRDPKVVELINARYLAVKVDQDTRPDISNRYEDYGWPATVVFASDGSEIVKRQGYLPPPLMASLLQAIIDDPSPGPSIIEEKPLQAGDGGLEESARENLRQELRDDYDSKNHGWGTAQKFLDWDVIEYCLAQTLIGRDAFLDPVMPLRHIRKRQVHHLVRHEPIARKMRFRGRSADVHLDQSARARAEGLARSDRVPADRADSYFQASHREASIVIAHRPSRFLHPGQKPLTRYASVVRLKDHVDAAGPSSRSARGPGSPPETPHPRSHEKLAATSQG